jgi:hypothetical protein
MARAACAAPVTIVAWHDLVEELDRWQEAGRIATLWWRDDDAVEPSAALDRSISLARDVPIALAVIPSLAQPELAIHLARFQGPRIRVLQHGWRHLNHAGNGKKSEFCSERSAREVTAELTQGRTQLFQLFGSLALPVLVPPWNRLDACFLPVVADCGIRAISRATPRRFLRPAPGLIQVNVHIDLVAWGDGRRFIGESAALAGLVHHLAARRLGTACGQEPTGILSHHLIQDEATDAFLRRLFRLTGAHGAARWLDASEVFSPAIAYPG